MKTHNRERANLTVKSLAMLALMITFLVAGSNPLTAQNDISNDYWYNPSTVQTATNKKASVGATLTDGQLHVYEQASGNSGNTLVLESAANMNPNIMFKASSSHVANIRYRESTERLEYQVGSPGQSLATVAVMTRDKMGIGTTNPLSKLHVNGWLRTGNSTAAIVSGFGGTHNFINGVGASGKLKFRINGADVMSMSNLGLAIGPAALPAGYKLSVDGKVICEELRVKLSNNWPDYVADEDYVVLGPVDQEKQFRATGALPGFPTEAELNGTIDLGEITRLQQEKIEELMLICSKQEQVIGELQTAVSTIVANQKN